MENIGSIIAAITGLITVLGGAVTWVWKELKAFKSETRADLEACRAREMRDQERRLIEQERRGIYRVVIELFWQEVERTDPKNQILGRAKALMAKLADKDDEIAAKDQELDEVIQQPAAPSQS